MSLSPGADAKFLYHDALQEQTAACASQQWAQCLVTTAVFDVRWNSRFGAMLNLFRSLFVIVALGCGAVLFNNDSNRLVLRPIERMLRKVCFPLACWWILPATSLTIVSTGLLFAP